jgi:hypothetical protein
MAELKFIVFWAVTPKTSTLKMDAARFSEM